MKNPLADPFLYPVDSRSVCCKTSYFFFSDSYPLINFPPSVPTQFSSSIGQSSAFTNHSYRVAFFQQLFTFLIRFLLPYFLSLISLPLTLFFFFFISFSLFFSSLLSTRSVFPEYYEVIKHPFDFTTIKEQFNKYNTIEEVLTDIRQIWDNCRLFNSEGSDISATADVLAGELEVLVEVRTLQNLVLTV